MPMAQSRVIAFVTLFMVLTLISAFPTVKAEPDSDDILGQMMTKRNSWWSKKSASPLMEEFPVHPPMDDMHCGKMKSLFKCYVRECVADLVLCARESEDSSQAFEGCKIDYRMCGLKCMSSASHLAN